MTKRAASVKQINKVLDSITETNTNYRHTLKEKNLFAYILKRYKLKTDTQLAEMLFSSTSQISQVRNDRIYLSPRLTLTIYDRTDLSIEDIRRMAREDY
jgi:iron-sulfur cluster repair protein YtfE (RIC family)